MPTEVTQLDHPMDVMYLIHKAMRAEARRTRQAAEHLAIGGNFKPFLDDFYRWAMALGAHAEAEATYILPRVPDMLPAWDNEGGHQALLAGLEDLQRCLHEELGHTIVIPRTRRQLVGNVIALLLAQADLLEEEEERLLPAIHQRIGEAEQLDMARRLLFDSESEDEYWMLDWVATTFRRPNATSWRTWWHALPQCPPACAARRLTRAHRMAPHGHSRRTGRRR